jgi:hypothetical protein
MEVGVPRQELWSSALVAPPVKPSSVLGGWVVENIENFEEVLWLVL